MKTARPCLAGAAALALALVVAFAPEPAPAIAAPGDFAPPRNHDSPYAHTAIGAVIDANDGKIPASGTELMQALDKVALGGFARLPIPFSAVALDSGLTHPRVVITQFPESRQALQGFGWGAPPVPSSSGANRPLLAGRLFLAANMELDRESKLRVRTVEFISWNSRKLKFDFGVIDGFGSRPELRMLDGTRCFSCHKNRGPILGVAPWSNTMHNELVHDTAFALFANALTRLPALTDGIDLSDSHAEAIDAAVRQGADLLRDRTMFQQLVATAEGRKALVLLVNTILTPGSLHEHDKRIKKELDALALGQFLGDARLVRQATFPSALRDFNPVGQLNKENPFWSFEKILRYAEARADGRTNLPSEYVPSNPRAFVRAPFKAFQRPSEVISAELLAQTIGLTEPDRNLLLELLAFELGVPTVGVDQRTAARRAIVTEILTGPSFADFMATGVLPDRDDFKDRFVAGLKGRTFWRGAETPRATYTSTPKLDPRAKPEEELPALPSHACLACHDVTGARKAAFNPIPPLAFDPFDATARAEWLKTADRKRKTEVLGRMLKRIGTDKDMPPADSTEHELYRTKDSAALVAVISWLEAELKKAK